MLCTLLGACHSPSKSDTTESPGGGDPSGAGGSPTAPEPPIRSFTPTTLVYEGSCALCKEAFRVTGFNNRNEIVGTFTTGNDAAFLWSNGTLSPFFERWNHYLFQHINDDGIIYGVVDETPAKFVGLEPTLLDQVMSPYVVNNLGHICGRVDAQTVCYIGDQEKQLDVVFDTYSELSDNGLLVGTLGGKAQILDIASGASVRFDQDSQAVAVNSAGQVVGDVWDNGAMRPFLYQGGVLQVLPVAAGYLSATATDINSQGEVVGVMFINGATGWHSPDDPTQGGVATTTLIDFFYCNAAHACMHVAGPMQAADPLLRIRINDLSAVVLGGDVSLTLYQ